MSPEEKREYQRIYMKKYYREHNETYKKALTKYQQNNPEKIKQFIQKWQTDNPERKIWHYAKQRAKKYNLDFTIKIEDIVIPETCPFLGIPLTTTMGQGRLQTNASLDRIDSTKGYTPDNIQIISDLANRMKQDATPKQLLIFATNIIKLYS